jgi:hypothetical protein
MIINAKTLNYYIVSSCKSALRTDHDFCCFISVIFISKRYCHKDCFRALNYGNLTETHSVTFNIGRTSSLI